MRATDNYQLDLYELEDNANLTDGYNHTVQRLDVILYQMQSMITSANNNIATIQSQIASLTTRVTALESKVGNHD